MDRAAAVILETSLRPILPRRRAAQGSAGSAWSRFVQPKAGEPFDANPCGDTIPDASSVELFWILIHMAGMAVAQGSNESWEKYMALGTIIFG